MYCRRRPCAVKRAAAVNVLLFSKTSQEPTDISNHTSCKSQPALKKPATKQQSNSTVTVAAQSTVEFHSTLTNSGPNFFEFRKSVRVFSITNKSYSDLFLIISIMFSSTHAEILPEDSSESRAPARRQTRAARQMLRDRRPAAHHTGCTRRCCCCCCCCWWLDGLVLIAHCCRQRRGPDCSATWPRAGCKFLLRIVARLDARLCISSDASSKPSANK